MNWMSSPSTELMQHVLMSSPNGVLALQAIRGADGRLIDLYMTSLNAVAEQELACPAVEVLGQSFAQYFPHLARKTLLEQYRHVLDTGQSAHFDAQYVRAGSSSPVRVNVTVVRFEKSLLITYTDMAAVKIDLPQTDRQLIFEESLNGISVFEAVHDEAGQVADFKLLMINDAGLAMPGFQREELIGQTMWEIYPATSINGLFNEYVHVFNTGQPLNTQHYYPEYRLWLDVKVVRTEGGIMVIYTNSTALKKIEEVASQQAHLLENIVAITPVSLAIVTPVRAENNRRITDFRVEIVSPALEHLIGRPAFEIVGQVLTSAFRPVDPSYLISCCITSLERDQPQAFLLTLGCLSDATPYWVTATPSGDQLLLVFTDPSRSE